MKILFLEYLNFGFKFKKDTLKELLWTNFSSMSKYRQLNADVVAIKSLYFESGSKCL